MTRVAFCADVHAGNHGRFAGPLEGGLNRRCWSVVRALDRAVQLAWSNGCQAFVVLGDLFHVDRPMPQMERAVQDVLARHPGMRKILLVGNHDLRTTAPADHALGPLAPHAEVIERPTVVRIGEDSPESPCADLLLVPFLPGHADDWLPAQVEELARQAVAGRSKDQLVLGIHLGVRGGDEPPWLANAADSVAADLLERLMSRFQIARTVAGNWHWQWENRIENVVQVGTLCPTGFNDTGWQHGGLLVYDTGGKGGTGAHEWLEVPGPRFIECGQMAAWSKVTLRAIRKRPAEDGYEVYARLVVSTDELPAAGEAIGKAKVDGLIVDGSAEPDEKERQEIAEKAAERARSAETAEEALVESVGGLALEEGVTTAEVIEEARSCLAAAAKRERAA